MSRYIDADEALRMMRNSREDNPCDYTQRGAWNIAHDCCISCLNAVPTADVAEVRHGEWKKVSEKYPRYVCTSCRHLYNNKEYKYCPNCCAKMDGKKSEDTE